MNPYVHSDEQPYSQAIQPSHTAKPYSQYVENEGKKKKKKKRKKERENSRMPISHNLWNHYKGHALLSYAPCTYTVYQSVVICFWH